jgi:hypothetical protein
VVIARSENRRYFQVLPEQYAPHKTPGMAWFAGLGAVGMNPDMIRFSECIWFMARHLMALNASCRRPVLVQNDKI